MPRLILKIPETDPVVIELKPGLNQFGRDEQNDVVIDDPSISQFQCEIEVAEGSVFVRDLSSTNGTFIGEDLITSGYLRHGQRLTLDSVMMEFAEDIAPAPASSDRINAPRGLACFAARMGVNRLLDLTGIPPRATLINNFIMVYGLTVLMRAMGLLYLKYKDRLSWFSC